VGGSLPFYSLGSGSGCSGLFWMEAMVAASWGGAGVAYYYPHAPSYICKAILPVVGR
jgi:hypothetical protein